MSMRRNVAAAVLTVLALLSGPGPPAAGQSRPAGVVGPSPAVRQSRPAGGIAAVGPSRPAGMDPAAGRVTTGYVAPLSGQLVVLTPFRAPPNPYGPGHRGVDLAAPVGATVRAAGTGTVAFAGMVAGRPVASVDHAGGLRTTYEPVTATVTVGQHVVAGQAIGFLEAGHASCAHASCLHWGARLPDRTYLDPMALLSPWRVRLLPWDGRTDQYGA